MESGIEATLYKRILHFFLKRPKVTVLSILSIVLLFFGILLYFSTKLNLNQDNSLTPSKNSPTFNLAGSTSPSPGAVEGANTQADDPAEPPASVSPSQDLSPTSTASTSATPTSTPTPAPTSAPTSTSTPIPTTPTDTPTPPTATPEASPTEPTSPSPSQ